MANRRRTGNWSFVTSQRAAMPSRLVMTIQERGRTLVSLPTSYDCMEAATKELKAGCEQRANYAAC